MPLIQADRVRETTTTTGQGTVTLAGAVTGFQSFSAGVGNGNTCYYTIAAQTGTEWEVGLGTYTLSGTTLSRDTVFASSAGGTTKVTFSAGTKDVFVTYPASQAVVLAGTQTFTGTQTFSGSSSALAMVLNDAAETVTVSATAATGTIDYDVTTQSVIYYTNNASANWTVNFRASSGTTLNTAMSTGQSVTVAFLVTQGVTAYYNNVVQVDGVTVTPKYQGGSAWVSGNASGIDAYVYTIVKTANATFTVFASQTQFA
jgi:hypothetical protein